MGLKSAKVDGESTLEIKAIIVAVYEAYLWRSLAQLNRDRLLYYNGPARYKEMSGDE